MASGEVLHQWQAQAGSVSATLAAQPDIIVGTSSPNEWFPVLAFDTTTIEYTDIHFLRMPPHYGGGGVTIKIGFFAGAATGTVTWEAAFRGIPDDAEDINTTVHTYDYNSSGAITVGSAIGEIKETTITFTDGADMDNVTVGMTYSLRIRRNTADSMASDAWLANFEMTET